MVLLSAFQKLKLLKQVSPNKLLSLPIEREIILAEPLKKIKVSNYKIIPVSNMCTTSGPSFNPDLVHCFDNVAAIERPKKHKVVHDENYP